jgi:hypothetical protein
MKIRLLEVCLATGVLFWFGTSFARLQPVRASGTGGPGPSGSGYQVLAPIGRGNLTVFPVVAAASHDTREFLTLDEGIRSGEVVVTEYGMARSMVRPRSRRWPQPAPVPGPQVNRLVLINNSNRPLLLLAGEIVTGGKQDRVIAEDRIVPPESDPLDLSVFCVEPGRWTGSSMKFSSMDSAMAAPAVRASAMADKNQQEVWSQVAQMSAGVSGGAGSGADNGPDLRGTTSYAQVMENAQVAKHVDSVAAPVEQSYSSLIRQLRDRNAVGVVAAVNGQIVWADVFASSDLLERYWPKLVRSYAAQAVATGLKTAAANEQAAQAFLDDLQGKREIVEIEPGLYRHTEITGDGFTVFELSSLLPKTGFLVHIAKMSLTQGSDPANDSPRD